MSRKGETRLTDKQMEIAWWLWNGLSPKLIASKMNLSRRTVECHILNATKKLAVKRADRRTTDRDYTGRPQIQLVLFVERNRPRFKARFGEKKEAKVYDPEGLDPSPREAEIAELVYEGYTYEQIAERLGISRSTVKVHVDHCAQKVGGRGPTLIRMIRWWAENKEKRNGRVQ